MKVETFRLWLMFCVVFQLFSCDTTAKLLYQTQYERSKIRFFETKKPKPSKGASIFYARVDSGNVNIYYSFWADKTFKTYSNNKNHVYTLVNDNSPMLTLNYIDTFVLTKADQLMDSLEYKKPKRLSAATGFVIEIAGH